MTTSLGLAARRADWFPRPCPEEDRPEFYRSGGNLQGTDSVFATYHGHRHPQRKLEPLWPQQALRATPTTFLSVPSSIALAASLGAKLSSGPTLERSLVARSLHA